MKPLLLLLVALTLLGCDQSQTESQQKTISGVFVARFERLGGALKKMGSDVGDMAMTQDFRKDGSVIRTFLGEKITGTYTKEGDKISVLWVTKDNETGAVGTSVEVFTVEGSDLLNAKGARFMKKN